MYHGAYLIILQFNRFTVHFKAELYLDRRKKLNDKISGIIYLTVSIFKKIIIVSGKKSERND